MSKRTYKKRQLLKAIILSKFSTLTDFAKRWAEEANKSYETCKKDVSEICGGKANLSKEDIKTWAKILNVSQKEINRWHEVGK